MKTSILFLLSFLAAWAPAQQDATPIPLAELDPLVAELRAGAAKPEDVTKLVEGLIQHDRLAAAGWWLRSARGGSRTKKLPATARKRLLAVQKTLSARLKKRDAKAFRMSLTIARHAESVANRKNFAEAARAAAIATRHLGLIANPAAERALDRVRKKLAKQPATDRNERQLPKQKQKTEKLRAASESQLRSRLDGAIESYVRFGCFAGYAKVRALVHALRGKGAAETLARLRTVTLGYRKADSLRVHVISFHNVNVCVNGAVVGTQQGTISGLVEEKKEAWKTIDVPVLPGDYVVLKPDVGVMPNIPFGGPLKMLSVHASLNEKSVAAQHYFGASLGSSNRVGTATLVPVLLGKKVRAKEGMASGPPGAPPAEFAADFSQSLDGVQANTILPLEPPVLEWFEKAGVEPIYIYAAIKDPSYVIHVPEAQ